MTTREKEQEMHSWDCREGTDEEKAEAGKRYEGCKVLMNLKNGSILQCFVKNVTKEGFHVRPHSFVVVRIDAGDEYNINYCRNHPIPFSKFSNVTLLPNTAF